ncbi:MAG: formyl transferase [Bacteroidales bacterium]|nr:formyl transferase [Bacteroidales bacterium]
MEKLNVVFIGGLTNGKIVYDYLSKNKYVNLGLVITYPDNTNKPKHIVFPDAENIIKTDNANNLLEEIKAIKPDFIFVSGWSELLSKELRQLPLNGMIGFHPSKLPKDRGRSVVAWQISEGYSQSAVTMFYYSEIPDEGDIIGQELFSIEENDYVKDIHRKIDFAVYNLLRAYFPLLRQGIAPRIKQDESKANFRRLRHEKDSLINWDENSKNIYNKIRAISFPYPGAIGILNNNQYKIWSSEIVTFPFGNDKKPGDVIAELFDETLIIKTRDGFIRVTSFNPL